jgi:hypothetical protein
MSAYSTDLQREVDRRWLHRLTANSVPGGRPKHPNDIRPLPQRPHDRTEPPRESELAEGGRNEKKPSRRDQGRYLMDF